MGKQVGKTTLLLSRITLSLKHTRHFIFLVFMKYPFCEEDMLHVPLFLDTGGFVLPIPCLMSEIVTQWRLFPLRKGMSLFLIPSAPVLWLFPVCLIYHRCNCQVLVCLLSSRPAFPILLNCLVWSPLTTGKQNWGFKFIILEDVTHAQGKACF